MPKVVQIVSSFAGGSDEEKEVAMERKRYSALQIVAVLKQAEMGMPVAALVRQTEMTEQTFYLYGRLFRCKVRPHGLPW